MNMLGTHKLSIVMPVYNELRTINQIIDRVLSVPLSIERELVIVDDCSTDGTRDFLAEYKNPKVRIFFQEPNQGKGAALRRGFSEVEGDIVIIQDADLEYDPHEYDTLIAPILDGRADVVLGSRFLGGPHRVMFFWHYLANKGLTTLSNMFTDLNLTDMETCYKAFRTEVLKKITLKENRFGFEPEFTAKVAHQGFRIYEVPISYSGRSYDDGKKIGAKDAFAALWCILRYNILPNK